MLYAEDTLAEIVQHAAEAGKVAGLLGSDVMTDATSSHEWEGRPKLYVIREQSEAIPDLADPFGYSGTLNSRITLAAIAEHKAAAAVLMAAILAALKRHLADPPAPIDTLTVTHEDVMTVDPEDELATEYREGALDTAAVAEGDAMAITAGDTAVLGRLRAEGTADGEGWLIATEVTGNVSGWLLYTAEAQDIQSWNLSEVNGVARFENGAFREQYIQTRRMQIVHTD